MSSFKYKPPKKIILDEKSITTLDSKHKELQTEYQYIQEVVIPSLKKEKNELKLRISQIKNMFGVSKQNIDEQEVDINPDTEFNNNYSVIKNPETMN